MFISLHRDCITIHCESETLIPFKNYFCTPLVLHCILLLLIVVQCLSVSQSSCLCPFLFLFFLSLFLHVSVSLSLCLSLVSVILSVSWSHCLYLFANLCICPSFVCPAVCLLLLSPSLHVLYHAIL